MNRLPLPPVMFGQRIILLGVMEPSITPTPTDIGYAAGFFDGEGNICIGLNHRGGKACKYPVYNMRIGATQNDPEPLIWIRERWGGAIHTRKNHFFWYLCARKALKFLRDLRPYLMVKKDRADLAIAYQEIIVQRGRAGRTSEHVEYMARTKAEMNRLNAVSKNEGGAALKIGRPLGPRRASIQTQAGAA